MSADESSMSASHPRTVFKNRASEHTSNAFPKPMCKWVSLGDLTVLDPPGKSFGDDRDSRSRSASLSILTPTSTIQHIPGLQFTHTSGLTSESIFAGACQSSSQSRGSSESREITRSEQNDFPCDLGSSPKSSTRSPSPSNSTHSQSRSSVISNISGSRSRSESPQQYPESFPPHGLKSRSTSRSSSDPETARRPHSRSKSRDSDSAARFEKKTSRNSTKFKFSTYDEIPGVVESFENHCASDDTVIVQGKLEERPPPDEDISDHEDIVGSSG
ncbi:hypothetical protein QAD02_021666 [Eretmocerus hayati]|uniref:Uncharacterized protein n=1 Tax=Eretmocerus hayati TaxID=131215 RepID=A0ACC2PSA5_9HYME|nr:hypothetical protein QAD02_021666 [Eretmocerus hayati]